MPNIPFYFFFNALLLVLTLMNIYWFLVSRGSSATLRWLLPPQLRLRNAGCLPCPGYLGGFRAGKAQGFGGMAAPRVSWLTVSLPPQYIVLFVAKVLMGQMQEVNDVREYDVEDSKKTAVAKKKEGGLQLPSALKEGCVGRGRCKQHQWVGGGEDALGCLLECAGKQQSALMQSLKIGAGSRRNFVSL